MGFSLLTILICIVFRTSYVVSNGIIEITCSNVLKLKHGYKQHMCYATLSSSADIDTKNAVR